VSTSDCLSFSGPALTNHPSSAFNVVTPRKSPMRSKVDVANGSNQSAQGILKTGSAVKAPDVTVQSESAACEVDPSKYYLLMKPHSSHANPDAYEIHVWVRHCQYFFIVLQSYAPVVCIALVKCIVFEASSVVCSFHVSWSRHLTVGGALASCAGVVTFDSVG
jgi:hypothetical protein